MKKISKIVGILSIGFILLIAVASIALKIFLTPEKINALIKKEAASQLHRQVELGSISVGIVRGLQVSNFKLSESPDFGSGTFIDSEKFVLHVRLVPLLFKKVLIKDIELVRPRVSVVRFPDAKTYNFSNLLSSQSTPSTAPTPHDASTTSSSLTLLVSKASIENGTVNFVDQSPSQQSMSIEQLNLTLKNFSLTAPISLQTSCVLKAKGTQSTLDFFGDVGLDGSLKIKTCSLTSGAAKIIVAGSAKNMLTVPAFDMNLTLQNLQTSLVSAFVALPKELSMNGPIDGSVTAKGAKDDLALSIDIHLDKTDIVYGDKLNKKAGITMGMKLASALKQTSELTINEFGFHLDTFDLSGSGAIQNLTGDNRAFKLKLVSNSFPLTDLLRHVPVAKLPADLKLSGPLQFSADVNGTADSVQLVLKTDAKTLDVAYGDSFKKPSGTPLGFDAVGTYANATLDFSALSITLGRMTLNGPGRYIADPKLDRYFFTLKSNSFPLEDVAAVVPMLRPYELSGQAELNAKILSTPTTPDVSGSLALSNMAVRYQDSHLTQIMSSVSFTPEAVVVSKLTGLLNGSSLKMDVNAQKIKTHPAIVSNIEVAMLDLDKLIPSPAPAKSPQKTDARDLFSVTEAFAETAPAKSMMDLPMNLSGRLKAGHIKHEHMTGENLEIKWNLSDVTPELTKMNGSATLRQGKGEFKNIQKLTAGSKAATVLLLPITLLQKLDKAVHGALKLPSFDDIAYKEILGDYSFKMGMMTISKFLINAGNLSASMTGTVGLAGAQPLDLKSIVKTSASDPALSTLNFSVKGTILDPKVGLDMAATGKNVFESLKNSGAADKLLQKYGLPGLGGASKPADAPAPTQPAASDSTGQSTPAPAAPASHDSSQTDSKQEQIKQLEGVLKGLFNK